MNFVEPASVYAQRITAPAPATKQSEESRRTRQYLSPLRDDFWAAKIFDELRARGGVPIRFTTAVNVAVRQGNFTRRTDREAKKKELFRLIGRMIRCGKLDRVERLYVAIPKSDARHKAWLAAVPKPTDLPPPVL